MASDHLLPHDTWIDLGKAVAGILDYQSGYPLVPGTRSWYPAEPVKPKKGHLPQHIVAAPRSITISQPCFELWVTVDVAGNVIVAVRGEITQPEVWRKHLVLAWETAVGADPTPATVGDAFDSGVTRSQGMTARKVPGSPCVKQAPEASRVVRPADLAWVSARAALKG